MRKLCLVAALLVLGSLGALSEDAPDPQLAAARRDYAVHFFSAESHLRFAKLLRERGYVMEAFFTCETARREHFTAAEFEAAFRRVFRNDNFDNSPAAEAALQATLARTPDDFATLKKLADVYISRSDWQHAAPLLQRAIRIHPDDFSPVGALAQVYRQQGQPGKGESLLWMWTQNHPDALETYQVQLERMGEKDPEGAERLVREALQKYPNDGELHYSLGALRHRKNDLAGAEQEFLLAAKLAPESATVQGWVARFFFKAKSDPQRALDYYLKAYFLDPDFYETEYAEGRIPKLVDAVLDRRLGGDNPPPLTEAEMKFFDPVLADAIVESAKQEYKADDLDTLLGIMSADDEVNRWNAMRVIAEHVDNSFDPRLSQLLEEKNLFVRGMAGYIAAKRWKERAIPLLKQRLDDPSELVRYDALSALMMDEGAQGRAIVEEYQRSGKEPSPRMRELILESLTGKRAGER